MAAKTANSKPQDDAAPADAAGDANALPFETTLEQLEKIVGEMESGAVSLEQCMAKFTEGMRLAGHCEKRLAEVERKIEMLVKTPAGQTAWRELRTPAPADTGNDAPDADEPGA